MVATSQMRRVASSLALAIQAPSGEMANDRMMPVCPVKTCVAVVDCQIRTVASSLALAIHEPSGEIATADTPAV